MKVSQSLITAAGCVIFHKMHQMILRRSSDPLAGFRWKAERGVHWL